MVKALDSNFRMDKKKMKKEKNTTTPHFCFSFTGLHNCTHSSARVTVGTLNKWLPQGYINLPSALRGKNNGPKAQYMHHKTAPALKPWTDFLKTFFV